MENNQDCVIVFGGIWSSSYTKDFAIQHIPETGGLTTLLFIPESSAAQGGQLFGHGEQLFGQSGLPLDTAVFNPVLNAENAC